MFSRPGANESEEDLLRFQQQFLDSKSKASAQVIRPGGKRPVGNNHLEQDSKKTSPSTKATERDVVTLGELPSSFSSTPSAPPLKKSKFKTEKRDPLKTDIEDPEEQLEKHDKHIAKVLSDIVERDTAAWPVYFPNNRNTHAFPTVLHRGTTQQDGQDKKKGSIFSQQFAKSSAKDFGVEPVQTPIVEQPPCVSPGLLGQLSDRSVLLSGEGLSPNTGEDEAKHIHKDNLNKLSSMSSDEILQERDKLLQMLDPSVVSFLAARKSKASAAEKPNTPSMETGEQDKHSETSKHINEPYAKAIPQGKEKLPVKPDKRWVHMDKIEYEKISWMKEMPAPKAANSKTGNPARFNFQGELVAADADLPTHLGLHHHGDEPERAGYTLSELFQLSRSANMQQRVMALKCLSKIISNARHGCFHQVLSAPLLPAMLEGGIIFILRWALDDSTDNTMSAAITVLHAFVISDTDEQAADQVFSWFNGHQLPFMEPVVEVETFLEPEVDKPQKTDADLVKEDVIKGLIRMDILPRLRYILKTWQPSGAVVLEILELLTRMARHSSQAAYEICQCSELLETIFNFFMPTTWDPIDTGILPESMYGLPVPQALRLVRTLASAGRNMAASMVSKYELMERLSRYLVQDHSNLQLPVAISEDLAMESLRVWIVCASYGLASHSLSELYPVLMERLRNLVHLSPDSPAWLNQHGSLLITLLTTMIHNSVSNVGTMKQEMGENVCSLNWGHVSGIQELVEMYITKWLQHFTETYSEKRYDLTFTSSCLTFLSTLLCVCDKQPGYDPIRTMEWIEKMTNQVIVPVLTSQSLSLSARLLRERSILLKTGEMASAENLSSLPQLGALIGPTAENCSLLDGDNSTVQFLLALSRLLYYMSRLHADIPQKICPPLLNNQELVLYLRKTCQSKRTSTNHFCHFENKLQYYLIKLAQIHVAGVDCRLFHQTALSLLLNLPQGAEHIAHDLLSTIIFNIDFLRDIKTDTSPAADLATKLSVHHAEPLSSATQQQMIKPSPDQLSTDTLSHLADIRATYLKVAAGFTLNLQLSRSRYLGNIMTERLTTGQVTQNLVPVDWPFLPVVDLYNKAVNGKVPGEECVSPAVISISSHMLRWIYVLETHRQGSLSAVSLSTKISRLMCIFLMGSDLFLDGRIHLYLAGMLQIYCLPVHLDHVHFEQSIPGLSSFYDLYIMFLGQFGALSFGDALFASFVLLPLIQRQPVTFRKAVWGEHSDVLRALTIPISQLPLPIERFLYPEEVDIELLRLYLQALIAQQVIPGRNSLLYLIAVHHVNRWIFCQDRKHFKLRSAMMQHITQTNDKILRKHLLYYNTSNLECEHGLQLYDTLPKIRQDTFKHLTGQFITSDLVS